MSYFSNVINITSENSNSYFYNTESSSFLISHPVMKYIAEMDENENDILKMIENTENDKIEIPDYYPITADTLNYYCKKCEILKNNGYFKKNLHLEEKLTGELNSNQIKKSFTNVNNICIEVTEKCNLKCEYCGYGDLYCGYDSNRSNDIDFNKIENLFFHLEKYWISEYNSFSNKVINIGFYGGEPLIEMDTIKKTIDLLKKYTNRKFIFSMTTNGVLLDKYIEFLVKNDFQILISLDGYRYADSYRKFHDGKESFNGVIKNIFMIKNKYPIYFNKKVSFNSVFTSRSNYSAVVKFFRNNFNKKFNYQEVTENSLKPDKKKEYYKIFGNSYVNFKENEKYLKNNESVYTDDPELSALKNFIFKNTEFIIKRFSNLIEESSSGDNNKIERYYPSGTCIPFSIKLFLTSRGKVLPCERIDFKNHLFQIDNDPFEIDFDKITKMYNDYFKRIKSLCAKCSKSLKCTKCIFKMEFDNNKIICDEFVSVKENSKDLSIYFDLLEKKPHLYNKTFRKV